MSTLPEHIAIIMDGNGRWARRQGLSRVEGHRRGAEAVKRTVRSCRELGIKILTLYAFSEQNWARPQEEVSALMRLLLDYVKSQRREILDNNIRLTTIGEIKRLPLFVRIPLKALVAESQGNDGMLLALALSYGGREEILRSLRGVAERVAQAELRPHEIQAEHIEAGLFTAGWPDPDLLIRTSGEERLSNFMLWQLAYSEFHFCSLAWPEFGQEQLIEAIEEYGRRQRRFGLTAEQAQVKGERC